MKKCSLFLCLVLLCTLCLGCHIQFGSHILVGAYRETPADAYMDIPYNNHITHTYLDTINLEIVCIPVSNEEVLWVALLNKNYVLEMPMLINSHEKYCSTGNGMVYTLTPKENVNEEQEIMPLSKNFSSKTGKSVYSNTYTDAEYTLVKDALPDKYTAIPFVVNWEGKNYNYVYVYVVTE